MEIPLETMLIFSTIIVLVEGINSLTSSQQIPFPGILCIKSIPICFNALAFHGLEPVKLFHLISENSHVAIYFIYFIFNKMVEWALATMRHKFQSVLWQRRQSTLDLLCCAPPPEGWSTTGQQWMSEPDLIKQRWRERKFSLDTTIHCLYNACA